VPVEALNVEPSVAVPLIVGAAVFAGGLATGGGGPGEENGGPEPIGGKGGSRIVVVVAVVDPLPGDFGFLTFTHRLTRV
jgi:hypothetical protein